MTLKVDAKLEENLTIGSKNGMKNFMNFNTTFAESILCLSQKSTEELRAITLNNIAKFEKKLVSGLKNGMRNLANFDPTFASLKICTLMGSFCPKYIIFEIKKYRGVRRPNTED